MFYAAFRGSPKGHGLFRNLLSPFTSCSAFFCRIEGWFLLFFSWVFPNVAFCPFLFQLTGFSAVGLPLAGFAFVVWPHFRAQQFLCFFFFFSNAQLTSLFGFVFILVGNTPI